MRIYSLQLNWRRTGKRLLLHRQWSGKISMQCVLSWLRGLNWRLVLINVLFSCFLSIIFFFPFLLFIFLDFLQKKISFFYWFYFVENDQNFNLNILYFWIKALRYFMLCNSTSPNLYSLCPLGGLRLCYSCRVYLFLHFHVFSKKLFDFFPLKWCNFCVDISWIVEVMAFFVFLQKK